MASKVQRPEDEGGKGMLKELVRRIVYPFMPEYIRVEEGTLKFRFINWLYEDSKEGPFTS